MNESRFPSAVRAAKKRKTAKSRSERIVFVVVFVLFFFYAAALVYPFLYCLNASLIDGGRAFMRDPVGMAKPPNENQTELRVMAKKLFPFTSS